MNDIRYITLQEALQIHRMTIHHSGGGDLGQIKPEQLESTLEFIQNDDYYPTFVTKLTHLVWAINRNHCFADGNKRLSITLAVQFMLINGYLAFVKRFMLEFENISYHLAAGRIDKDLLERLVASILEGEADFDEVLKLALLEACQEAE